LNDEYRICLLQAGLEFGKSAEVPDRGGHRLIIALPEVGRPVWAKRKDERNAG